MALCKFVIFPLVPFQNASFQNGLEFTVKIITILVMPDLFEPNLKESFYGQKIDLNILGSALKSCIE
jgi:hypothetical protein